MKRVLLIFCVLLMACGQKNGRQQFSKRSTFTAFLKKFKDTSLPIVIRGCDGNIPGCCDSLKGSDSIFISELNGWHPLYKFKTNGNYIAVICMGAADCMLPIITTFDSTGRKLDEQTIAIGDCGSGPGFTCHEYMTIRSDYSLYTSDTITECEVDSLYHSIPGTEKSYIEYKEGRLLSSGKKKLSDLQKKNLKD